MPIRRFRPDAFLRAALATEPFAAYCHARGIPFQPPPGTEPNPLAARHWADALAALPADQLARVELELTQVEEMAAPDAVAHLIEAAGGAGLPPDDVPAGVPLALWFLTYRPELFRQVYLHHELCAVAAWRTAYAPPGLDLGNPARKAPALAAELRSFFKEQEGVGRFCAVQAHRLGTGAYFVARLADRLRLVEVFTDGGALTAHRVRPAVQVSFAYDSRDGVVLVQSRLRARERVLALVRRFGRAVLGVELGEDCLAPAFNLSPLKQPFAPLLDDPDMAAVRVKALHLRYPARIGYRLVKLETHAGDGPAAVPELLRTHLNVAGMLEQLDVCYAELQVRLRVEGGEKSYMIRLAPDRCNLDQTPVGERLRACLRRWGLCHAC